jgi:hypothetical protein
VVVVEEPGEEPKLYRQDTGELVTDLNVDPFLINGENNEHPNNLPKSKENATKSTTAKMYKDIDELIEKLKNDDKNDKHHHSNTNSNSNNNKNSTNGNSTTNSSKISTKSTNENPTNSTLTTNNQNESLTQQNRLKEENKTESSPQTPSVTRKNSIFKPLVNEKEENSAKKMDNINTNKNEFNSTFSNRYVSNQEKLNSQQPPAHIQNPSPISIHSNTNQNSKKNDTNSSGVEAASNTTTTTPHQESYSKVKKNVVVSSPSSTPADVSTMNNKSSRKSETIAISRALANNNTKISKEYFVSKASRPRSSSTKANSYRTQGKKSQVYFSKKYS